jgi:nonsense-mediated mRNA decay protein 3
MKKTVCDVCSKKFGGYHEAIIQIRSDRTFTEDEIQNMTLSVENTVENLQAKGNRSLFIADIGMEHGGLDFFISDKQAALVITKKLQEMYGGSIKQSSKNIGMRDSKQIHRMTYLLRIPVYKKDDFIKYETNFYQIKSVQANNVKLINLSNWEEKIIDIKNLQRAKILGGNELIIEQIMVSQNDEEIQVMDSKTYKISIIKKPKKEKIQSKNVKIIKANNQLFIQKIKK